MSIIVACRCGQAFEADAWLAGKVVQCPTCNSPIAVPSPTPETPAAPLPRLRSAVSREDKEATESVMISLVVGAVILVVVLCLSAFIFVYLKGSSPSTWFEATPAQSPPSAASQQSTPELAGPVPAAAPSTAGPIGRPHSIADLPESWQLWEHPTARFSALLPGTLEMAEKKTQSLVGENIAYILAASEGDHAFEASREFRSYKITPGQEAATYNALIKQRVEETEGGKVEGTAYVMIGGRLVCDARLRGNAEGEEFRTYIRLIAAEDWVMELSCRVPPGKERPAEIKAFLGTYRLD
ncbi:MAG: hypothetical protein IAF94_22780 [Pirellulaceae bacterium]|nr:hypothetical protein [Pirellulaceae bacterium]